MTVLGGAVVAEVPCISGWRFAHVDGDRIGDRLTLQVASVEPALGVRFAGRATSSPYLAAVVLDPEPRLELRKPRIRVDLQHDWREREVVLDVQSQRSRVELAHTGHGSPGCRLPRWRGRARRGADIVEAADRQAAKRVRRPTWSGVIRERAARNDLVSAAAGKLSGDFEWRYGDWRPAYSRDGSWNRDGGSTFLALDKIGTGLLCAW